MIALDAIATIATLVILSGILAPTSPGWKQGGTGAIANGLAAGSLTWLLIRLWAEYAGFAP